MRYFLLTFFTIFISILEILAYKNETATIIASRIWLIWTVSYVIYSLYLFFKIQITDFKSKKYWGILALFIFTILCTFQLTNFPITLSGEGSLEFNQALNYMNTPDLGYTKTVFLGNMNRQYLLAAIPSFLTGRGIISQRIGIEIIFLLGAFIFYCGIRTYFKTYPKANEISALAILAIICFPVVTVLLRMFDAVILPLAFTLHGLGFLLILITKPTIKNALFFGWAITTLGIVYTPALGTWTMITLYISFRIIKLLIKKKLPEAFIFLCPFLLSLVFTISAFQIRQDVRFFNQNSHFNLEQTLQKILEGFQYFFYLNTNMYDQHVLFTGHALIIPVIMYFIGSLTLFFNWKQFILSLLIISVIIVSSLSSGYASPPIWYGIHRAAVTIPFLILGIISIIIQRKIHLKGIINILIFCLLSGYGIYTIKSIYITSQENFDTRSLILQESLKTTQTLDIKSDSVKTLATFTDLPYFTFFKDNLVYFYPKAKIMDSKDCSVFQIQSPSIIFADTKTYCYKELITYLSNKKYQEMGIEYFKAPLEKKIGQRLTGINKIVIF